MSDLFSTGSSGLLAFQRAIATTSHNIANVETEGYSRQRIELQSRTPTRQSPGAVGSGVYVNRNERIADEFANARVVSITSEREHQRIHRDMAGQLDEFVASDALSLTPIMNDFFASIQDANADPSSSATREVLLANAEQLAGRFNALQKRFDSTQDEVNDRVRSSVAEINELTAAIGDISKRIDSAGGIHAAQPPNDLIDQRQQLVTELAEHIDITALSQDDGTFSILVGQGIPLVMGDTVQSLRVVNDPDLPSRVSIEVGTDDFWQPVDNQLTGGKLGGLREFESDTLSPAIQELGRLATVMVNDLNEQHAAGVDLDGIGDTAGEVVADLFSINAPSGIGRSSNASTATLDVTITDTTAMKASDYLIKYDGTDYTVTRVSDGQISTLGGAPLAFDGLSIAVNGTPSPNDQFTVSAISQSAGSLTSLIKDPRKLALASDATVGNNENGLALADFQVNERIEGGSSFNDTYASLISRVGGQTRAVETRVNAVDNLFQDAVDSKLSVSGVNLDEEAVNLARYEQAYQAAAQIISVADDLFNTLLGAVRR